MQSRESGYLDLCMCIISQWQKKNCPHFHILNNSQYLLLDCILHKKEIHESALSSPIAVVQESILQKNVNVTRTCEPTEVQDLFSKENIVMFQQILAQHTFQFQV